MIPDADTFTLMVKTLAALGVVLGLAILTVAFLKRFIFLRKTVSGNDMVTVLSITPVAPKKSILLVKVVDQFMVVGMTESDLNILTNLTAPETVSTLHRELLDPSKSETVSFADHLGKVWGRLKS